MSCSYGVSMPCALGVLIPCKNDLIPHIVGFNTTHIKVFDIMCGSFKAAHNQGLMYVGYICIDKP